MLTERTVLSHGFAHQLHGSVMTLGSLPSPARWVIGASLPAVLYGARSTTFSLAEGVAQFTALWPAGCAPLQRRCRCPQCCLLQTWCIWRGNRWTFIVHLRPETKLLDHAGGCSPAAIMAISRRFNKQPPAHPFLVTQAPEKRVVKLPTGRPTLFAERSPNPANANSAVAISFQVWFSSPLGCVIHINCEP